MLVLSRKVKEVTYIMCPDGTKIVIRVEKIQGNRVSTSYDAPEEYVIIRKELMEERDAQKNHEEQSEDTTSHT